MLASATFTSETASGWQQVTFASPVSIAANTTYVASYYTASGFYSITRPYFTTSTYTPPLRALADGDGGGNGVYRYGTGGGFPTSSANSTNYWVDVVFTTTAPPPPPPPPTLSALTPSITPAGGSAFTLSVTGSNFVSGSVVRWNGAGRTTSFTSSTQLTAAIAAAGIATPGTAQVTVANPDGPVSNALTFTIPAAATTCPCSIWTTAATPAVASVQDANPVELGVRFRSDVAGFITGIRFYKGAQNTGPHTGNLYTATGTVLASATFTNETASGWQQVTFASPVSIAANTDLCRVLLYAQRLLLDHASLLHHVGLLRRRCARSPTAMVAAMACTGTAPVVGSQRPRSTPPITGSTSSSTTRGGRNVPVQHLDARGDTRGGLGSGWEPGGARLRFRSDVAGVITGIRFYKGAQNTGPHTGNLYTATGTVLASATFTNETASGWQQVTFASPVSIAANTTYVASYYTPSGFYSTTRPCSPRQSTTPPLRALADGDGGGNGVYRYGTGGKFRTSWFNSTNYWVDVVFNNAAAATCPSTSGRPRRHRGGLGSGWEPGGARRAVP